MASITEILMNMASQQAKTAGQQQENQYASIRNQFAPEGFRLQNELTAGQVRKIPAEIQQLLAAAAMHRAQTSRVPYLNAMNEAQLNAQPLVNAIRQMQLNKAQRELASPDYQSTLGKAMGDAELIKQAYGEKSPEYQNALQYIDKVKVGSGGITMFDENGNPIVQVGGSSSGKGGKGGGTFKNAATGEVTSSLTIANLNRAQKSIISNEQLQKEVKGVIKNITPYLGLWGDIRYGAAKATGYLGLKNKSLSKYNSAISAIKLNADRLLGAVGINGTEKNVAMLMSAFMPSKFEGPKVYEQNILETLKRIQDEEAQLKRAVRKGVTLGVENGMSDSPQVQIGGAVANEFTTDDIDSGINDLEG
jgi:hypothetical protein